MITTTCYLCKKEFAVKESELKRGGGKFCSLKCSSDHKKISPRKVKTPNATCALCGTAFYKRKSSLKNSKSGLYFCCRNHKDQAQKLDGIEAIFPDHYGTSNHINRYREHAFKYYEKKCMSCGYDSIPEILQVHHKDRNRKNGDITNLSVLCPNCHMEEHFKTQTGLYTKRTVKESNFPVFA